MSTNNVQQQGIALICGAAAYALALTVGASGPALAIGLVVGGVVLVAQGQLTSKPEENDVKTPPTPKKQNKKEKTHQKKQAPSSPVVTKPQPKVEAPTSPEKEKASKKKKKSKKDKAESTPATPATSATPTKPAPQEQKKTPHKEEEGLSKAQQKKLKAKQKKEEEEKKKAEEAARLAAEQKREAAQKKKKEAKARKAAAKASEKQPEVQPKLEVKEEVLEPGWEKQPTKKKKDKKEEEGKKGAENVVIEVRIPARLHGRIIGTNRSGIEKLEQTLDVKIEVPKKDTSDFIRVQGAAQNVAEAKKAMEQIASKGYSSVTNPGFISQTLDLTNESQIGLICGTGGKNVKAIQTATKARIDIPDRKSNDLTITFHGEPDEIRRAMAAVQDLLNQGYSRITHPGWTSEEVQVPPEAVGVIIGKDGAKIKQLQKETKATIQTPKRDDPTARPDIITIKGIKSSIANAKAAILELVASLEAPVDTEVPDPVWQEEVTEVSWD